MKGKWSTKSFFCIGLFVLLTILFSSNQKAYAVATVSTYDELKIAISSGETEISLSKDIEATTNNNPIIVGKDNNDLQTVTINGNGHGIDFKATSGNYLLVGKALNEVVPKLVIKDTKFKRTGGTNNDKMIVATTTEYSYVRFEGVVSVDAATRGGYVDLRNGKIEFKDANFSGYTPADNGSNRIAFQARDFSLLNSKVVVNQENNNSVKAAFYNNYRDVNNSGIYQKVRFMIDNSILELSGNRADWSAFLIYTEGHTDFTVKNDSKVKVSGDWIDGIGGDKKGLITLSASRDSGNSIKIESKSTFEIISRRSTALAQNAIGSKFIIDDAKVKITGSNTRPSPLIKYMDSSSGNSFEVRNGGELVTENTIDSTNVGYYPNVVEFYGNSNDFIVNSGGKIVFDNSLYTTPPRNGVNDSAKAAIKYNAGNNNFTISDATPAIKEDGKRTEVTIISDYSPAVYSTGGILTINQMPNTIMSGIGSSASDTGYGTFVAENDLRFLVDNPYYYDFRNIREDGGQIFGGKSGSSLLVKDTSFSAWRYGDDLKGTPSNSFNSKVIVDYLGQDYNTLGPTISPIVASQISGLRTNIKRISANNASPKFKGIRQPTTADKRVVASFVIPEGNKGARTALEGEVYATLKITRNDGTTELMTEATTGYNPSIGQQGIKLWEETIGLGGRVEFNLNKLLEEGDSVEIVDYWRYDADPTSSSALHGDLTLVPAPMMAVSVTPPPLVDLGTFSPSDIKSGAQVISGTANNVNAPGNHIELYVNSLFKETTSVNPDGSFQLNLTQPLNYQDNVQLVVRDDTGAVIDTTSSLSSKFAIPTTNNKIGNGNPLNSYQYHDVTFPAAVSYSVGDGTPPTATSKINRIRLGDENALVNADLKAMVSDLQDNVSSIQKITAAIDVNQDLTDLVSSTGEKNFRIIFTDEAGNSATITTKLFIYDPKLTVQFVNEAGSSIHKDIEINQYNTGDIVDLTKIQAISDAIAAVLNDNYKLETRPTDETAIEIKDTGTVVTYRFKGQLLFGSSPSNIDFGNKEIGIFDIKVDQVTYDQPMIVWDNRAVLKEWKLTATLMTPLMSDTDNSKILPDAIKYQKDANNLLTLSSVASEILVHTNSNSGGYNVSDDWNRGKTGLKLEIPSGQLRKLGNYQAEMLWKLEETP